MLCVIRDSSKNLSVNSVHLVEGDHRYGQSSEGIVGAVGFLIPWEEFAEAVEPGMSQFNDPPSRLVFRTIFNVFFFLSSGSDVGKETIAADGLLFANIPSVQTQVAL